MNATFFKPHPRDYAAHLPPCKRGGTCSFSPCCRPGCKPPQHISNFTLKAMEGLRHG